MAFTQNFNSDTFGPIQWKLMGPIADRPATADLHTTYVSTDEGDGILKAYLYTESGWMQMQGIEGFTSGSGGGSGDGGTLIVHVSLARDATSGNLVVANVEETIDEILAAIAEGRPVEMHVANSDYDQDPHTDFVVYPCEDAYTGDAESIGLDFKYIYIDVGTVSVTIKTYTIGYTDSEWTYAENQITINK